MTSGHHMSVKQFPPFGEGDVAARKVLKAHVVLSSLASLDDGPLRLLASDNDTGYWVDFTISPLMVSKVIGVEPELAPLNEPFNMSRKIGCLLLVGTIVREYCGDELNHYKEQYNARVLAVRHALQPRSGFTSGTMQLISKGQTDEYLRRQSLLDVYP